MEAKMDDLTLGDEFKGMPVHLMTRQSNPQTRPITVVAVGYNQQATELVEWYDVNGTVAEAQKVIDEQVIPAIREYLEVAPPLASLPGEVEAEPEKPLTAAQVRAVNARAEKAAAAKANKK